MGDFEGDQTIDPLVKDHMHKAKPSAIIMLLLGLFAPLQLMIYGSEFTLQSIFWSYSSFTYGYSGFQILPYFAIISLFPMILLRLAPVSQINRYYKGKTTRKRALLSTLVGDGLFLFMSLVMLILPLGMWSPLYIPLPFQMIFGLVVLWRYPIPIAIVPWEGMTESKSWWEKKPDSQQEKPPDKQQEKPPDDEDKLW